MKRYTLTFALSCAICAFTYAGPEPLPSKEIAPAPPPPTSCFEGWYFGVQGSGLLQQFDTDSSGDVLIVGPQGGNTFTDSDRAGSGNSDFGGAAGLHMGYNWQRGGWIFGAEADVSVTDFNVDSGRTDAFVDPPGQSQLEAFAELDSNLAWYSTVRPRIGHTLGERVHAFLTGGLAVGLIDFDAPTWISVNRGQGTGLVAHSFSDSGRDVRIGWTAGGGLEFCLTEHIILNFTYLFMDLGNVSNKGSLIADSPNGNDHFEAAVKLDGDFRYHVFQGGLSFHF